MSRIPNGSFLKSGVRKLNDRGNSWWKAEKDEIRQKAWQIVNTTNPLPTDYYRQSGLLSDSQNASTKTLVWLDYCTDPLTTKHSTHTHMYDRGLEYCMIEMCEMERGGWQSLYISLPEILTASSLSETTQRSQLVSVLWQLQTFPSPWRCNTQQQIHGSKIDDL